jgi:hypothetical protein
MIDRDEAGGRVEGLLADLDARAAGWWISRETDEGPRLELLAFRGAADLPAEVARGFEEATASVPLDRLDLGIVRAAVESAPAVSVAMMLPSRSGSGHWLHRFEALRSVAVPLVDGSGHLAGVLSVALPTLGPPLDEEVIRQVQAWAAGRVD